MQSLTRGVINSPITCWENGIRREDIIAVYAHRNASLAWALLGILKAGAAFLILDPVYPAARLIQFVRAAKPRGLINLDAAGALSDELDNVLQATVHCHVTLLSPSELGRGTLFESHSTADPKIEIRPDDLAYVSYTSGSTGEPKGVQGTHGPLSHFLPWQVAHFGLTSADRFSLLSGLSHDPLHREIFTALWVGGTICIPDPDLLAASGELPGWMAQQRVTFAHLTPALGRLLAESAKPQDQLSSLRYAFFVGDKLTWTDIARLRRFASQATTVNYYGSTETQRAVSYHEIPPDAKSSPGQTILPVGRGMPDAQLLVLTHARNLAGLGEVGEIYMRSPHLARGYLGDASLTQARFKANPFTGQVKDRLYRTGDIGRYLRDGSVEVLGRTDGQIKIRGFRVEPGEIELTLSQHPLVRNVVVTARDDVHEDKSAPRWVMHCHCENCRRAVSSAVATYLGVRLEQFRYLKGEPTYYDSSPGVKRYFCATCGSPMAYTGERWPGEVHLFHGTLNDPSQWPPTAHGYVADQLTVVRGQRSPAALCGCRRKR